MDLGLKNKVVVITGGASGIGYAIAQEFAQEGAIVAVFNRSIEKIEHFRTQMEQKGFVVFAEQLDVTDTVAVEHFTMQVIEKFGHLDIWINNAGINIVKPFWQYTAEEFNKILAINLNAVFDCSKIASKQMKKQHSGVIINVSSFASVIPSANNSVYSMTKAAVSSFTKTSAAELAPYGIRVNGLIPGKIMTEICEKEVQSNPEKYEKDIALKQIGLPQDVAKPVVFLASQAASYITGIDLIVAGGKFIVQNTMDAWENIK